MTRPDDAADAQRQNLELRKILDTPLDESLDLHLTVKDLRWIFKWHGDLVRLVTLIEVQRSEAQRERVEGARNDSR